MVPAIIFDDGQGRLSPLTDLRASFDVRTGALTTAERLCRGLPLATVHLRVPDSLAAVTSKRHSLAVNGPLPASDADVLVINGRCVVPPKGLADLARGHALVEAGSGHLIAARISGRDAARVLGGDNTGLAVMELAAPALMSRPWHVRTFRDAAIAFDLDLLGREAANGRETTVPRRRLIHLAEVPGGVVRFGAAPLIADPTAKIYPSAVFDLEHGPIVVDAGAVVRPGAVICGPCYIGPSSTVIDRSLLKANTAIGPHCKVAGEVGGTIIQGYSNKAHDGHLGDSWLGEWVNLGAGTTNSNLLNTYGEVITRAAPDAPNERTGETFLGAIIGDHVKTAICTRLMTGVILHTGCMVATTAPASGCVPGFTWATDTGSRRYRLDKFLDVMRAMMSRRKVEPTEAYLARLAELHASGA